MRRQRVAVYGSTGSIGRSCLDVVSRLPDRFEIFALAAHRSVDVICAQARRCRPRWVLLSDKDCASRAQRKLGRGFCVLGGDEPLADIASDDAVDTLVMAMSGTGGLDSVLTALHSGKRVALATKEILVSYGIHVMTAARRNRAELLPIDSELAALHQCLHGRPIRDVKRVLLTASGGPFWRRAAVPDVSIPEVLRHPTWSMGPKITVDSATLANKGLEVIEAVRLFGLAPEQVETVIHPQSTVHALVEFNDGSLIAQLSTPDMRLPIQYCLTYPERLRSPARTLSLTTTARLEFHRPDRRRFPCLGLAYRALRSGPMGPCLFNAANEVAVRAFLNKRIEFGAIPSIIRAVLNRLPRTTDSIDATLPALKTAERQGTALAEERAKRLAHARARN